MQIRVTKQINGNDVQFIFDDKDIKESLVQALSFLKFDVCECGSKKIFWNGYRTKENYLYVKRVCGDCKKQSNLSQNQTTKDYFWKEWETYNPENKKQPTEQAPTPQEPAPQSQDVEPDMGF